MNHPQEPAFERVGVFGGAFDPPHRGHRRLAEAALLQLNLDRLHILPTGEAWHKSRTLSAAEHRVAMCELAFGDLPRVRIDQREISRAGPSYTIDTLLELGREYPGAQFYLVLGDDQFLAFKTWLRWQEILQQATLAVALRASDAGSRVASEREQQPDVEEAGIPFVRLEMPLIDISATAVRALANTGHCGPHDFDVLVPEGVARYISQHHLYQNPK